MSYLVLARKYRPQTFAEVVGQEDLARTLQNAIRLDKVGHAYLFAGPRGTGKTSMARILAKALNCEKGPAEEPCNACAICTAVAEGRDVDVIEIDAASNRGIDEIRELRESARLLPARARFKIYIVDEVHMLTKEAFNALLKILEEPPARVKFIFATTHPQRLLETVRSRCQRFDFRRIREEEIEARLREVARREGSQADADVFRAVARRADGGMRDALSLLDQVLVSSGAAVTLDAARAALGVVPREAVDEVARAAGEGDAGRALLAVAAVVDAGREPTEVIDALVEHFRNLLWLSVLPEGAPPPDAALPDVPALREAAGAWGTDTLLAVLRLLLETRREARGSELARFHLELAIVRITRLRDLLPIETILERLKDLERRLGEGGLAAPAGGRAPAAGLFDATPAARPAPASGPAPAPRAPAAPPAKEKGSGTFSAAEKVPDPFSPAAPPPAGAAVDWPSVVRSLGQSSPGLAAQLGSAREGGLQGDTFTLYFPASSRFLMESVQKTANKRMVEDALARVAGGRVVLRCQEAPEEPAGPESQGRPSGEVRKLIERFGGEIQPPPGR